MLAVTLGLLNWSITQSGAVAAFPPLALKVVRKVLLAAMASLTAFIPAASVPKIWVLSSGVKAGFQRLLARSTCRPLMRANSSLSAAKPPTAIAVASPRATAVQSNTRQVDPSKQT